MLLPRILDGVHRYRTMPGRCRPMPETNHVPVATISPGKSLPERPFHLLHVSRCHCRNFPTRKHESRAILFPMQQQGCFVALPSFRPLQPNNFITRTVDEQPQESAFVLVIHIAPIPPMFPKGDHVTFQPNSTGCVLARFLSTSDIQEMGLFLLGMFPPYIRTNLPCS